MEEEWGPDHEFTRNELDFLNKLTKNLVEYHFTEDELNSVFKLNRRFSTAIKLMHSENITDRYRGALALLKSPSIETYNNSGEGIKAMIDIDTNKLEKKAVEILVDQGYNHLVKKELLEKHRYSVSEEDKE